MNGKACLFYKFRNVFFEYGSQNAEWLSAYVFLILIPDYPVCFQNIETGYEIICRNSGSL
jgi:hypothetical protein